MALKTVLSRTDVDSEWTRQFGIQSMEDLDFVIAQGSGCAVGMSRRDSPEFRRRILAAAISYKAQLSSMDYALKRYVKPDQYEDEEQTLGNEVSDFLRASVLSLEEELRRLHTKDNLTFGIFGAELTLFRVPYSLDTARMLANRGLLFEVIPILRLCLEMIAWATSAFCMADDSEVTALKAPNCVARLKNIYGAAGKLYGWLSNFAHWGHIVHNHFIKVVDGGTAALKASVKYRAMSLALCVIIVDVMVEAVRWLYVDRSNSLVIRIQGALPRDLTRNTYRMVAKITEETGLTELQNIQALIH